MGLMSTGDPPEVRCHACKMTPKKGTFPRCGRCKKVRYCGAACQRRDWSKHKKECVGQGCTQMKICMGDLNSKWKGLMRMPNTADHVCKRKDQRDSSTSQTLFVKEALAFLNSARSGHLDTCKEIFAKGEVPITSVDENNESAMHHACFKGHIDVVRWLLEQDPDLHQPNSEGESPFHRACRGGRRQVAELLLDRNAKIEQKDKAGTTALHRACYAGNAEIVEMLLEHKANVNAKDNVESSALHWMAMRNTSQSATVYRLLVHHGIDKEAKNAHGEQAVDVAKSFKNETVELLLKG